MSKALERVKNKIFNKNNLLKKLEIWRGENKKIVFTNGCFDLIHLGHIEILARSSDFGDKLIIGVNSDLSIKKLKGENRPIIEESSRIKQLSALEFVDAVVLFDEDTPLKLIETIKPDVITKGGDYTAKNIVGNEVVSQKNGEVIIIPLTQGYSTTSILNKIKND
ncbi:MAG: D-glycero-beta-D-manno-heptose 1-phosphate adenylyltransferase [Flavobacteriales bacterium]